MAAAPVPALRPYAWLPAAGAGVLGLVGSVFAIQSRDKLERISFWQDPAAAPASYEQMAAVAAAGKQDQLVAGIACGAAGAGLVMAGLFFLSGDPSQRSVALHLAPGSAGVAVSWRWP